MFKKISKGLQSVGNILQSPFLLLIRLYWGYLFTLAGLGKLWNAQAVAPFFKTLGIPSPYLSVFLAGGVEFFGGILLVLGLFSRFAALALLVVAAVILYSAGHDALGSLVFKLDPTLFFQEAVFLFAYATLIVFIFGPGKFSLDHWLWGNKD